LRCSVRPRDWTKEESRPSTMATGTEMGEPADEELMAAPLRVSGPRVRRTWKGRERERVQSITRRLLSARHSTRACSARASTRRGREATASPTADSAASSPPSGPYHRSSSRASHLPPPAPSLSVAMIQAQDLLRNYEAPGLSLRDRTACARACHSAACKLIRTPFAQGHCAITPARTSLSALAQQQP
jgi:hypothetical protein